MGMIDKLRAIDDWKTVTVIIFFLAVIFGTITLGTVYDLQVLYIGALVALGIPTSLFGNIGTRVFSQSSDNKTKGEMLEQLAKMEKQVYNLTIAVGNISNDQANYQSQIEVLKMGLEKLDELNVNDL